MTEIRSKTGLSLIELVVSSFLMVVVVLGIFSVNVVLNNNGQDYGQKYLVRSQTQNTVNHILKNAYLAVGDGGTDAYGNLDLGVWVGAGGAAKWGTFQAACTICVHQAANNNIINSGSDIWLCYTWYPPGEVAGADYQIKYCAMPFVSSASLRGAWNCNFAPSLLLQPTYLGTANSAINNSATFDTTNQPIFNLTITNCLDNSLASCQGSGTSTDPGTNPEIQISGSVDPVQESS